MVWNETPFQACGFFFTIFAITTFFGHARHADLLSRPPDWLMLEEENSPASKFHVL